MAPVQALFQASLLRSRAQFLGSLPELQGKVAGELNGLAGELDGLIKTQAKAGVIPAARLKLINSRIAELVPARTKGIESLLDNQIRISVGTAAVGKQKAASVFSYYVKAAAKEKGILKVPEINVAFGGGMANFVEELRNQVWDKRWTDGKSLSQRIWNFNQISEKDLLRKVRMGVEEGLPAQDVAKGLRQYLTKEGPGTPTYRAMRVARTECNEAYNLAHDEIAKKETFVKGTKWNLSGSHKRTDVCDDYAEGGPTGDGVYPVGEVPTTPHPHCLCFRTDEIPNVEEFLNRQTEVPGYGSVDKSQVVDTEYAKYLEGASREVKPVGFNRIGKMSEYVPHRPSGVVPMRGDKGPISGWEAVDLTRKKHMRKLGFAKYRVQIEKGLDSWAQAVHLPESCWLRGGVNKMYGLPWQKGLDSAQIAAVKNLIAEGKMAALDSKTVGAIKAYKAYTQALLKSRNIESLTVWRGITRDQAARMAGFIAKNDVVEIPIRSLSSFSPHKGMAIDFANQTFPGGPEVKRKLMNGVVFKISVKADDVFIYSDAGGRMGFIEGETIVATARGFVSVSKANIEVGELIATGVL